MKRRITILIPALLLLPLIIFAEKIKWVYDIEEAKKLAKKQDKIIMVDVYTDWCGWCKRLDATTYQDKKVLELSKKMINAKINPEKAARSRQFATEHQVRGYPAIIFIDAQEKELYRQPGYADGPTLAKIIQKIIEIPNLDNYRNEFENKNYKNSSKLIGLLIMNSKIKEAEKVLKKLDDSDDLSDNEKAAAHTDIGLFYANTKEYSIGIVYFERVDKKYKGTGRYYENAYYYIYALHLNDEKDEAKARMDEVLGDKNLSGDWKSHLKNLKTKLKM